MSYRSVRGLLDLVSLPLRSLPLSVLALGGLLLAPSARAAAEPGEGEEGPVATITSLKLEEGALRVGILWSDKQALPEGAKLVSYDGKDSANDSVEVSPQPGKESEVKLEKALLRPWETGWNQRLVLVDTKDPKAEPLATLPITVNLDCTDGDDKCTLTVAPGAASNSDVVHLSAELDEVITKLEESNPDKEIDLIEAVKANNPRLLGEALAYTHAMSKYMLSGPCTCVWQAVYTHSPAFLGYGINFTNASGTLAGWNGPGAKHSLVAIGGNASGIATSVTGISQVRLKLNCTKWVFYYYKDIILNWPWGKVIVIPFPFPRLVPCISSCTARFDHQGRVSGSTFVTYTSPGSSATAKEQAVYRVDGTPLLTPSVSQGGSFNQINGATVFSNIGSTGRVDSYGYVQAAATFPYFASASVANGHSIAIHGYARCPYGPNGHAAVWTYGTSQGIPQTNSLRSSIQNFFLQWGILTLP
ncbi:hypothetical protein [Myxococcus sp. CA040A]|uniref:hypothetical protein n=1 Tax=Myxococcus sp. CA040A TaxID=2741738 RepID=UPI00157AC6CF|nr:hypothetical protein [Myxococcus sp. CA040A]NTX08733.1 hypothetical protein [Myxococcus sp. CA040A]